MLYREGLSDPLVDCILHFEGMRSFAKRNYAYLVRGLPKDHDELLYLALVLNCGKTTYTIYLTW
jgi:hypothetical protein